MADAAISRRGFLGHVGGAYSAITMGAGTVAIAYDPMISLIETLRRQEAVFNTYPDDWPEEKVRAFADETYQPFYARLCDNAPMVTTTKGAAEAVRLAMEECSQGTMPYSVLASALAFLEAQAA